MYGKYISQNADVGQIKNVRKIIAKTFQLLFSRKSLILLFKQKKKSNNLSIVNHSFF